MRIMVNRALIYDTDNMDLDEVKSALIELRTAIDAIEYKIELRKAESIELEKELSLVWLARATYALKRRKRGEAYLREMLAGLTNKKVANARLRAECFADICKGRMEKEEFDGLMAAAEERRIAAIYKAERELERV
jgi:hypothetical protein